MFTDSALAECYGVGTDFGVLLWTAGQLDSARIPLVSRASSGECRHNKRAMNRRCIYRHTPTGRVENLVIYLKRLAWIWSGIILISGTMPLVTVQNVLCVNSTCEHTPRHCVGEHYRHFCFDVSVAIINTCCSPLLFTMTMIINMQ